MASGHLVDPRNCSALWRSLSIMTQHSTPSDIAVRLASFEHKFNLGRNELTSAGGQLSNRLADLIEELQSKNEAIEAKNKELELRADRLTRSNEELQQFAFVASHDLQAPLRNIAGFVELLSRTYGDALDDQAKDWIKRSVDAARKMRTLINDLLAFSRVQTESAPKTLVELNSVVAECQETLRSELDEKQAQLEVGKLPSVMADRAKLGQLLSNLIANAIKYNRSDHPRVVISAQEDAASVTVRVADNGIGIDEQYFGTIFEIFRRLHTDSEFPGSGIGLAISQRVARQHDGYIAVESEVGAGSVFSLFLPKQITLEAA